jgi:hypothetical protein
MQNEIIIALLTARLGEIGKKLFHLGNDLKLMQLTEESKKVFEMSGDIWTTLTECNVTCDDITYEKEENKPGFIK